MSNKTSNNPNFNEPRRIALLFGTYPDHCFNAKPYLDGEFAPVVAGPKPGTFVANEAYCQRPGAVRVPGNLPVEANSGVHAADDVLHQCLDVPAGADQLGGESSRSTT